jgi:16S rRNA (uracil1498-N3)-methyltransferase
MYRKTAPFVIRIGSVLHVLESDRAMTARYYAPDLPVTGGIVRLSETERQHALRVMRIEVGEQVTLFDGCGKQASAVVVSAGRKDCVCDAEPPVVVDRELGRCVQLAIALPKPDRARELVERLTELGVAKVTPLIAAHSQRPPSESNLDKLRRAVIEACKQCGRNQLMAIDSPLTTQDFFDRDGGVPVDSTARWIAHPGGAETDLTLPLEITSLTAMIGPEGGFAEHEIQQAIDHGFTTVGLGKRIFRVETAAVVIAAAMVMGDRS